MKAYFVSVKDNDDQGGFTVFANTVQEARKKIPGDLEYDRWIDVQAWRTKQFDNMENLSKAELTKAQWRDGWNWEDYYNMPDCDEATDEDFYKWYDSLGWEK